MEITSYYPFSALVGQERMKKALILNVVNPALGGVLIRGEKGTAKSTAVRALASLLPPLEKVAGCPFNCNPWEESSLCPDCKKNKEDGQFSVIREKMRVIELPINATEDRVAGTIDLEHAIKAGEKRFEPGILAWAHRNILYVDEVNLLDDHLVDLLLDAAAMGVNTVEREGISFSHPARFVLVGTMNPEEGELRPQLLDRFGLSVEVKGEQGILMRMEVIKRRMAFEEDPAGFAVRYQAEEEKLLRRITEARSLLSAVVVPERIYEKTARLSLALEVDGHRADLTMIKTAKTLAAYKGQQEVGEDELWESALLALPHRMKRLPFQSGILDEEAVKKIIFDGEKK